MERIPFVLASGSPRRRTLLSRLLGEHGFHWTSPAFDEGAGTEGSVETPTEHVLRLADGKRESWTQEHARGRFATCFVLSADTIVEMDGRILGKPHVPEEARRMLQSLSGRRHEVVTGMSLAFVREGRTETAVRHAEITGVVFAELTDDLIDWYVATGEPMDKAGAYGIQGHGALLVERIEGCYYNVMGLPLRRLFTMIGQVEEIAGLSGFVSSFSPIRENRLDGGYGKGSKDGDEKRSEPPDHAEPAGRRPAV